MKTFLFYVFLVVSLSCLSSCTSEQADPYLWLEEIDSEQSLAWVQAHNQTTMDILQKHPKYEEVNAKILEILNSKERIAYPEIVGDMIYNFWQDQKNERGLWRRCSLSEYLRDSPDWETVLDMDLLCEREKEQWAFDGAALCYPDYDLCMLRLSRKGSDAVVMREFDLRKKAFVKDGFTVPQAKGDVDWLDKDTLLIATDFGPGTTTDSGYPRIVKIWKRGMKLNEAETLFEGEQKDVSVWGDIQHTCERRYVVVERSITFYTYNLFVLEDEKLVKLEIPEDALLKGFFKNQMLVELKSDWEVAGNTYKQGWLIGIDYYRFLRGDRDFDVLDRPDERSSITSVDFTAEAVLVSRLNNVRSEIYRHDYADGKWKNEKVPAPEYGNIWIAAADRLWSHYFFTFQNFLTPNSLYYVSGQSGEIQKVKSLPDFFDGSKFQVKQQAATSTDGTEIPYFLVCPKDMKYDGSNPTLQYGYGGFEVSMRPWYSAGVGSAWLENGGVYVLANIRGGGEFGPKWHQAALKENRQRGFDDFIAVSEDLIRRNITSPKHLGIMGGSNGGLLVGVVFTQRPDLYNAVVCSVPLCDMKRYNKLLAGPSWMGEYGDPDVPDQWKYLKKYSPYHNVFKSKEYPKVFFTTTTRDDRVHPGHARKMAAKMEGQGHEIFYFENIEGGHGAGVTNKQKALMISLEYTYLLKMLKD